MVKRLTFRCWNCLREYSMTREIEGKPKIVVACPYCDKEAVADLDPYRDHARLVYRSPDEPAARVPTYIFPAVIPTAARSDAQPF